MPGRTSHPPSIRAKGTEPYWFLSTRPLHILAFLLPLVILYEIGTIFYLSNPSSGVVETIGARSLFAQFCNTFGNVTIYFPGIAIVSILLFWHVFAGDRTVVRPKVVAGLAIESIAWVVPLLLILYLVAPGSTPKPAIAAPPSISDLPWQAQATLSVGAGIYEELLFRLVMIPLIHFIAADLLKIQSNLASGIAVVASAIAFAAYHHVSVPDGDPRAFRYYLYYACGGAFFGILFLARGFGVIVGTHAVFDLVVLLLIPALKGENNH